VVPSATSRSRFGHRSGVRVAQHSRTGMTLRHPGPNIGPTAWCLRPTLGRVTLEWEQVLVHSVNPVSLGRWWAEALGWDVVYASADEFEIRPEPDRLPGMDFVRLDESKNAKSRLHLDFRPDDQAAEVARLVAHGAQRVDIGQGDQPWVVLADPEGNEFCVLGQRRQ
jgi:hypothetical protein